MNDINGNMTPEISEMLLGSFEKQRQSYLADPVPDYQQRKEDLLSLKRMLSENREDIIGAI